MHIWQICDIHARDFVGMAGQARPIRLEAVRAECDRTDDPEGNFQKVMLIEAILFPSRYLKKSESPVRFIRGRGFCTGKGVLKKGTALIAM